MKNKISIFLLLAFTSICFVACDNNDDDLPKESKAVFDYIINYGSSSGTKGTITAYDTEADTISDTYYKKVNGVDMVSNPQFAYNYNGKIYLMGNAVDEVYWVDAKTFEQTENGISTDIVKPRFCIGHGDYLYVSCYGGDVWFDSSMGYIAKINLITMEVETIDLPGGPEGLEIVGNKLFVALRYGEQIAEIDLDTEEVSFTDVAGQPIFFRKDPANNLYVSVGRNYGDEGTQTGLGYFNTQTNTMDEFYPLDNILNTYDNVIDANADFSKIYVAYSDGAWPPTGNIGVFDVAGKQFESEDLVEGIESINGVQVLNDNIILFVSPSTTVNGKAIVYSVSGEKLTEQTTGISPIMLVDAE